MVDQLGGVLGGVTHGRHPRALLRGGRLEERPVELGRRRPKVHPHHEPREVGVDEHRAIAVPPVEREQAALARKQAYGVALQSGKIVAAGVTYDDTVSLRPHGDFMVARYTPNGELDPGFGVGGVVTTNFDTESYDEPYAVVLQPDGRITLGGSSNTGGGIGRIMGADNLALARYLPNGLADPSFGDGGKVVVDAGAMQESIRALALQPDGSIVAAGRTNGEKRGDLLVARFLANGALDPTFGGPRAGLAINDLGTAEEGLTSVVLAPDGWIVAGPGAVNFTPYPTPSPGRTPFTATIRLPSVMTGVSGSVDASGGGTIP